MNLRSRDYASDLKKDIEALHNILRFVRGESLDPEIKQRVVSDLTGIVERELARLQHALRALGGDGDYVTAPVKIIKNEGAQARMSVHWALKRLKEEVLPKLEGAKKHQLETFLDHATKEREKITSVTNRVEMKNNPPKWKKLLAEIQKKEASLTSTEPVHEEKTGRRFRED